MKFALWANKPMDRKGSVTLEMAILMPIVIGTILFFTWIFQLLCMQNSLEHAVLKASDDFKKYAVIYHEYGVAKLENKLLEQLDSDIAESFIDLRGAAQSGQDYLYEKAVEALVSYYLDQDPLVQNGYLQYQDLSCAGGTFFDRNDDIYLNIRCKSGLVPVGTSIRFRGWIRGDSPVASITESGISVWSFDNFTRGKILRDVFGGDLPYDYPVIASFDDGTATMIKSLDSTKPAYQDSSRLASEVQEMIRKLHAFKGTAGNERVEESLWIQNEEIKKRKLLLILPENPMTQEQSTALFHVIHTDAVLNDVEVEIKTYQKSPTS